MEANQQNNNTEPSYCCIKSCDYEGFKTLAISLIDRFGFLLQWKYLIVINLVMTFLLVK